MDARLTKTLFSCHAVLVIFLPKHNMLKKLLRPKSKLDFFRTSYEPSDSENETMENSRRPENHVQYVKPPPKHLFCFICKKLYTTPIKLKCSHSFCKECIMPFLHPKVFCIPLVFWLWQLGLKEKLNKCPICFDPLSNSESTENLIPAVQLQVITYSPIYYSFGTFLELKFKYSLSLDMVAYAIRCLRLAFSLIVLQEEVDRLKVYCKYHRDDGYRKLFDQLAHGEESGLFNGTYHLCFALQKFVQQPLIPSRNRGKQRGCSYSGTRASESISGYF